MKGKPNQTYGFPLYDKGHKKTVTISGRRRINKPRVLYQISNQESKELALQLFSSTNLILKGEKLLPFSFSTDPAGRDPGD